MVATTEDESPDCPTPSSVPLESDSVVEDLQPAELESSNQLQDTSMWDQQLLLAKPIIIIEW